MYGADDGDVKVNVVLHVLVLVHHVVVVLQDRREALLFLRNLPKVTPGHHTLLRLTHFKGSDRYLVVER